MRINHNIAALNTYRQLTIGQNAAAKNMEKLSSGLRINRAGDDAAGLAISEKMRGQIRGLEQASRNAQDGISMIQTAEGALNEVHSILQRMRELANQSANGTNTDDDRKALQNEVKQLKDEIDRIGNTTEFNTKKLLNGSLQSAGAVTGTNTTSGAVVLEQRTAKVISTVTDFKAGDYSTVYFGTGYDKEQITINNVTLTIDWSSKLTDTEKALLAKNFSATNATEDERIAIKSAIERAINQTIDEYNASNGASLEHVKVYESGNKLVLESGKGGEGSNISFTAKAEDDASGNIVKPKAEDDASGNIVKPKAEDDASGNIVKQTLLTAYFSPISASANSTADTITSTVSQSGNSYMKTSLAGTETLSFEINGVRLQTAALSSATAGTTTGDTVAADIQSKIRNAIQQYNQNAGLTKGMEGYIDKDSVFVDAKDGRFVVSSGSGPITFIEKEGQNVVESLGLTQAQTEAAGNGGMTFQIGANRGQVLNFGINDMRTQALGVAGIDISTQQGASAALDKLDNAIRAVSSERAKLGAVQNRLEHTINNLGTAAENLTAAESRIRDVDYALAA
ncbi:flagellin [Geobacillus stearothermophilus]|uniref:flagellin N-terminal helical domain-containing protein n=1 Tax=Geobacillus stearothermophilus TaxID=1422 RepID=UPI002E1B4DDC|nr:flagellin [Geobacillus stearothermophilus]